MSSQARVPRELLPQEMSTAIDWLDGELSSEAAIEFELRLASDPTLAASVEGLGLFDARLRRQARSRARLERTRSRWSIAAGLAAAAVLAITLLAQFFAPRAPDFEVALASGFALAEDWAGAQPELRGASAPGIAVVRGAAATHLSADEFLRASELSEAAVIDNALSARRRELDAGWFVVPLELSEPASVLVLAFSAGGPLVRLFPDPEHVKEANLLARLEAGRHVLPSARAVPGRQPQALDYRPGFLVPLGAEELTVLVCVHRDTFNAADLAQLEASVAGQTSVDRVEQRLASSGFKLQRLTVREPR